MANGQNTGTVDVHVPVPRSYLVKTRSGYEVGTFFCILPEVALALQGRNFPVAADVEIFALTHGEPPRKIDPACYGMSYGAWKPASQIPTIPQFVIHTLEDSVGEEGGPWTAPKPKRE